MHEIRFHGRGGQGTVVASILLAKAFFLKDELTLKLKKFPFWGML